MISFERMKISADATRTEATTQGLEKFKLKTSAESQTNKSQNKKSKKMSNTQKSMETPTLVQSPLVTATQQESADTGTAKINIQLIRKLESWQLQVINCKASQVGQYIKIIYEIKKTAETIKQVDHGTEMYCDCLKVCI